MSTQMFNSSGGGNRHQRRVATAQARQLPAKKRQWEAMQEAAKTKKNKQARIALRESEKRRKRELKEKTEKAGLGLAQVHTERRNSRYAKEK